MIPSNKNLVLICILIKKLRLNEDVFYQQQLRQKIAKLYILYKIKRKRECTQRTCWVRPIFTCERRFLQGASDNLIREMENEDVEKYVDYFRMPPQLFNKLLKLIEPNIIKQNVIHDPIPSHTRLQVTLRYLASGDSMKSLSYAFRIGHSTVSQIITETCHAIWNSLKNLVFITDDEGSWQGVADEFESLWNFPHCIGAIDGKHIAIQVC